MKFLRIMTLICLLGIIPGSVSYGANMPKVAANNDAPFDMSQMPSEDDLRELEMVFEEMLAPLTEGKSEAEKQKVYEDFANELERTTKIMENRINNMSDDERDQFVNQLNNIENMNDDELDQFLLTLMPEDESSTSAEESFQPIAVEDETTKESAKETAKPKPVDVEEKIAVIKNINDHLDSFLKKMDSILRLPGLYENWGQKKRLHGWTSALTWDAFQKDVEELKKTFHVLLTKNPETKKYKYLDDLIADEALWNEIENYNTTLKKYEPLIDAPALGGADLKPAAKDATRYVINACLDTTQSLLPKVDAIIAKYDPTAQKIKKEKEAEAQKALEQTKKAAPAGRTVSIGQEESSGYGDYYGGYDDSSYYPSNSYYPSSPSYSSGKSGSPSYSRKNDSKTGGRSGSSAPSKSQAAGKKGTAEKASGQNENTAPQPAAMSHVDVRRLDGLVNSVEDQIELTADEIRKNSNLKNIQEYLKKDTNPEPEFDVALASVKQSMDMAAKNAKTLQTKMTRLSDSMKNTYANRIKKILDSKNGKEVATFIKNLTETERGTIASRKRYAYFGQEERELMKSEELQKLKAKGIEEEPQEGFFTDYKPSSYSLLDIAKSYISLKSFEEELNKKKK